MAEIMTVLGPIDADKLAITLPHEHLLSNLYSVTGDPNHLLNDTKLAVVEALRYRDAGGATLVEVTSRGLGRNPQALKYIAEETDLYIVMGCGWYRESYFTEEVRIKSTMAIAEEMVLEITEGVADTGIRAGIIGEIGCDKNYISPAEERALRAAARAQVQTGLAITMHSARCRVGLDQLDLLKEEGVDLNRVIISHCDTCPDPDYQEEVARRGAYVGLDTIRGLCEWETQQRIEWIKLLIDKGYLHQILLSHDVCMKSHLHAYGGHGYDFLLSEFVPRLSEAGLSNEQVHVLFVENPRAALTGSL
jgi:phosphotriesterase-related protein